MTAILTSTMGGSEIVDGKRIPAPLLEENGLKEQIKAHWKENANVLIISASPDAYEMNDSILLGQKAAFAMSGLSTGIFALCDYRNPEIAERINGFDVVLLFGGHVPTQNAFFREIGLKERLRQFQGLLLALSAGSMNCAETVYAQPELEGEAVDAAYQRFMEGLGITKHMLIPHFQELRNAVLDGMRVIEDITYTDSMGKAFIALNDGSYLVSENGTETLYGEAYLIRDGKLEQICRKNEQTSRFVPSR